MVDQATASDCQPPSHFIPLPLHEKSGLGPVCFGQWGISRLDIVARNVLQSCKWAHSFVSLLSSREELPLKIYWPFSLSPTVRDTPLTWVG